MESSRVISLSALSVVLTGAAYTEMTARKIPNWLTMSGVACGLMLAYLPGGISLGSSMLGLAIGFGFLFIFYLYGGMGGGDVKLMGAVGALLGYPLVLPALFYTAFCGMILTAFCLFRQRAFWMRVGRLAGKLRGKTRNDFAEIPPLQKSVPYGLAIAAGSLVVMFRIAG